MMIYFIITSDTLVTANTSELFSMEGGPVLIGIMTSLLPVPAATVLPGIAQTFSNGSRVWLYRYDIKWVVLLPYSLGALIILSIFISISYVPSSGVILVMIGIFPFLALLPPYSENLNIQKKTNCIFLRFDSYFRPIAS